MDRKSRLICGPDGLWRCGWCGAAEDYIAYHDQEWGVAVHHDVRLFEKICLEGFQAGLSWLTILRKREAFRKAFAGFDFRVLAAWGEAEVERLMRDPAIIRHRGKIASVLNNARRACELVSEAGSLAGHLWSYAARPPEELARDLKRRGWTFVGPTTVESLMQAAGMVDAHEPGCWRRGAGALPGRRTG